jgi:tungstate transport system ATP-binding protein
MLFRLRDIKKTYPSGFCLSILDLHLEEGKAYAIYGPNGSGKTTLMRLLSALDRSDEGEILYRGNAIDWSNRQNIVDYRRSVGLVMQRGYLFAGTVVDNLIYGLRLRSASKKDIENRIDFLMESLNLWDLKDRSIDELSGGERQRVIVGRSLILGCDVTLFDEVTTYVDSVHREIIENAIKTFAQEKKRSVVFSTHDISQAYRLADEVIYLVNGSVSDSPLENIFVGDVISTDESPYVEVGEGRIYILEGKEERSTISISPRDIVVSKETLHTSARNNFAGNICGMQKREGHYELDVDSKPSFKVWVTPKSFRDMELAIGHTVFLTFKASSVRVY